MQLRTATAALTRRPVLSVRRRIINTPATSTATITTTTTTSTSAVTLPTTDIPVVTSKFSRLRSRPTTTTTYATATSANKSATTTTLLTTLATLTTNNQPNNNNSNNNNKNYLNNKQKIKSTAAVAAITTTFADVLATLSTPTPTAATSSSSTSSSLATSSSATTTFLANDITQKSQSNSVKYASSPATTALRRKFQTRRLPVANPSAAGAGDDSATEPPRTQNPLFKRRFSRTFTTAKLAKPKSNNNNDEEHISNLDLDSADLDEASDQVAKSSIHTSRFNQIANSDNYDNDSTAGLVSLINVDLTKATQKPPKGRTKILTKTNLSSINAETITRRMDLVGNYGSTEATMANKRRRPQKSSTASTQATHRQQATPTNRRRSEHLNRLNGNPYATKAKQQQKEQQTNARHESNSDYEYYDADDAASNNSGSSSSSRSGHGRRQQLKVILHGRGIIECLDQGNFPHPLSCNKFISCAKFETGGVVGWEYTCPKGLSYDPVGGMCNWSANCKD